MKIKTQILAIIVLFFAINSAEARVDPEKLNKMKAHNSALSSPRMNCQPSTAQYDMEINNVRARLLTGGDIWWNLQDGRYIVPKPAPGFPEVSSIFAGGVWVGGVDPNGALKLAGVTYRTLNAANNATDFYPGPLDENGLTDLQVCTDWDDFFVVKGENVLKHIAAFDASVRDSVDLECDSIPEDVLYWPGRGNPFWSQNFEYPLPDQNLGNFWDEDEDGIYNPCSGDFPVIDIRDCEPATRLEARELLPDEMVFWVYNDNGGNHVLSGATAIQMEIQVQSFAYATNDEINDMSFYRFKLINRASDDIRDCYFAMWVDPDLGCSEDDYIGCDVERSMGYVYNEDAADGSPGTSCPGGVPTYELDVPILGIDYFRGPRGPKVFATDEFGNIQVNSEGDTILLNPESESGEMDTLVELGMTSFLYQNRGVSNPPEGTQDPDLGFEFYNILKGQWKDGTAVTFGGSGFDPASTDSVNYVFPDPPNDDTGWSMCTADLPFDDRRTVQATGPLLLQPGAKNELIIGAVFVPNIDYPCPDISRLQFADDLAQTLFNNCFNITDGPDAPDMFAVELDRQLILLLSNDSILVESNNAFEEYIEKDLRAPEDVEDIFYRFEGYQIYQLANPNVSVQELDNVELARLIRQVDVKNGVDDIYNWFPMVDPDPSATEFVWVPQKEVSGGNKGISHSFNVTIDQFSNTTDRVLVNHKNYYYTVLAYGYNNYQQYDVKEGVGQRNPFIEGRRNVNTYTFTPRPIVYQELQTAYGQEAPVTRIDGVGTGFNALDLADGEIDKILEGSADTTLTYKPGNGPINAKVIDPLNIKNAEYRLEIVGEYNDVLAGNKFIEPGAKWNLTNISTGDVIVSEKTIEEINEQIIYGEGFSISVNQVGDPGDQFDDDNGALTQVYEYADANETNWWNAVPAFQGIEVENPNDEDNPFFLFPFVDLEDEDDPGNALSQIDDGYFIPMKSARWINSDFNYLTPAWKVTQGIAISQNKLRLKELNNVDLVFTSDKSKWSKCIVVESAVPDYLNFGLATEDSRSQFELRAGNSIDENGNEIEGQGMSYFPGYAIDVETGERLNVFFGENSVFSDANDSIFTQFQGEPVSSGGIGQDMIWNPSTELFTSGLDNFGLAGTYNALVGGQHYIYVTRQEYDECESLKGLLEAGGLLNIATAVGFVSWTAIPVPAEPLLSLEEGLIPNDLTVKLRVTNPFNRELNSLANGSTFEAVGGLPAYEFAFTDVEAQDVEEAEYSNALDNVQVVPNPYYAYSAYEQGQFDNTVKVTNLPPRAIVTIYTLDGKFIQQFNRDAMESMNEGINPALTNTQIAPAIEWNLTNNKGIPVASGVYLFHISAPDLGIEKTVKWFGVNRRFDPTGL